MRELQSKRRAGSGGGRIPSHSFWSERTSPLCITTVHMSLAQLLNTCSLLNCSILAHCLLADANNQLKANANEMNSMKSQLKLALGELARQGGQGDPGHKVRHTD